MKDRGGRHPTRGVDAVQVGRPPGYDAPAYGGRCSIHCRGSRTRLGCAHAPFPRGRSRASRALGARPVGPGALPTVSDVTAVRLAQGGHEPVRSKQRVACPRGDARRDPLAGARPRRAPGPHRVARANCSDTAGRAPARTVARLWRGSRDCSDSPFRCGHFWARRRYCTRRHAAGRPRPASSRSPRPASVSRNLDAPRNQAALSETDGGGGR